MQRLSFMPPTMPPPCLLSSPMNHITTIGRELRNQLATWDRQHQQGTA
jgi:hypothetical protein